MTEEQSPSQQLAAPQMGTVTGSVSYTPGDGEPIPIPEGMVEITMAADSATLSWDEGESGKGLTAMPKIQFDDYVSKGLIRLDKASA